MSNDDYLTNSVRDRMARDEAALGMIVRLGRSGDAPRIAKMSGHDFIFVDCQHALFDIETIGHIAQVSLSIGLACVARVRSVDDPNASLLLDNGVSGIVFPDVSSAEQARRAVRSVRFPPVGARSAGGASPFFDYAPVRVPDLIEALDRHCLVVCMVETAEGLENLEEIAAVDGVDVVHIGSNDLLISLGRPGRFDDPIINETLDRAVEATGKRGAFAGCGGQRDPARQAQVIERGVRFVTTQSDVSFIAMAANDWTGRVRSGAS